MPTSAPKGFKQMIPGFSSGCIMPTSQSVEASLLEEGEHTAKLIKKAMGLPSTKITATMPTRESVRASLLKSSKRAYEAGLNAATLPGGLRLDIICPKKGDDSTTKFSPYLHAYLKKLSPFLLPLQRVYKDNEGTLYIGHLDEDNCFTGCRLYQVLCRGTKAQRGAYVDRTWTKSLKEDKSFWKKYAKIGRCAIDPEHQQHFVGDEARWDTTGKTRHCLWCGNCTQKRKDYIVREKHSKWENIPTYPGIQKAEKILGAKGQKISASPALTKQLLKLRKNP